MAARITPPDIYLRFFGAAYPAVCQGAVPQQWFPETAGTMPWTKYETIQSLCVGAPIKLLDPGRNDLVPSMWCRCRDERNSFGGVAAEQRVGNRLTCSPINEWGRLRNSKEIMNYCFMSCHCPPPPEREFGLTTLDLWAKARGLFGYTESFVRSKGDSDGEWEGERGQYRELESTSGREEYETDSCESKSCVQSSDCQASRGIKGCAGVSCVVERLAGGLFPANGHCLLTHVARMSGHRPIGRALLDQEHLCACNSSFVGAACCSAVDGLVWDPGSKEGELKAPVVLSGRPIR